MKMILLISPIVTLLMGIWTARVAAQKVGSAEGKIILAMTGVLALCQIAVGVMIVTNHVDL